MQYFDGITGTLAATLRVDGAQLDISAAPFELHGNLATSLLALPQQTQQWLGFEDLVPISLKNVGAMHIALNDSATWQAGLEALDLTLGTTDTQVQLQGLSINGAIFTNSQVTSNAQVRTQIHTRLHRQQLPAFTLQATQNGSMQLSAYTLELQDTAQSIRLHGKVT